MPWLIIHWSFCVSCDLRKFEILFLHWMGCILRYFLSNFGERICSHNQAKSYFFRCSRSSGKAHLYCILKYSNGWIIRCSLTSCPKVRFYSTWSLFYHVFALYSFKCILVSVRQGFRECQIVLSGVWCWDHWYTQDFVRRTCLTNWLSLTRGSRLKALRCCLIIKSRMFLDLGITGPVVYIAINKSIHSSFRKHLCLCPDISSESWNLLTCLVYVAQTILSHGR